MIKNGLIILLFLIPVVAFAQYPNNPNKIRLGFQTTGNGLIYRGAGAPTLSPTGYNSAFQFYDTIANTLWVYQDSFWYLTNTIRRSTPPPYSSTSSGLTLVYGHGVWQDTDDYHRYEYIANDSIEAWVVATGTYYWPSEPSDIAATGTTGAVKYTAGLWNKVPTDSLFRYDGAAWVFIGADGSVNYLEGDAGTVQVISNGDTIAIVGGYGINTSAGATDAVTVTVDTAQIATPYDVQFVQDSLDSHIALDGDLSSTNEIQQIDTFSLSGTTLSASLSSDGVTAKTVNLSPILTGYHTGAGTSGRVARWTGTYTLGDGALRDDGTLLALGGVTVSGYSFYDYSTGGWRLPVGTTAQRPGSPTAGGIRYSTTNGTLEYYGAAAWEIPVKSATATGLFTAGSVLFADANGRAEQDNANLLWDNTNNRLGINASTINRDLQIGTLTATPTTTPNSLSLGATYSTAAAQGYKLVIWEDSGASAKYGFGISANNMEYITGGTSSKHSFYSALAGSALFTILGTGNVGVANAAPSYIFDITSTGGMRIPVGTTAQRPTNAAGVKRYNTSLAYSETANGSTWLQSDFPTASANQTLRHDGTSWVTSTAFTNTNTVVALSAFGAALNITNSAAETTTTTPLYVLGNSTGTLRMRIKNSNSAAAADTRLLLENDAGRIAGFYLGSSTQGSDAIYFGENNIAFISDVDLATGGTKVITFNSGGYNSSQERMRVTPTGVHVGGTANASRTLHVTGEARITDLTTDTPTQIVGADADGDLGAITVGTGLSLSAGTLTATGTGTMSSFTLAGSSGTPQTINDGNTLTVEAGYGMTTTAAATDKVTVTADTTKLATLYDVASVGNTLYTGDGTIAEDRTVTVNSGQTLRFSGPSSLAPGFSYDFDLGYDDDDFALDGLSFYGFGDTTQAYIYAGVYSNTSAVWGMGVSQDINVSSSLITGDEAGAITLSGSDGSDAATVTFGSSTAVGYAPRVYGSNGIEFDTGGGGSIVSQINNTTETTLTSTGLGISDTSPEKELDVAGMGKFRQLSGQDNTPSIGTNANMGTGRSASITSGHSSDVAGRISFTSGTTLTAGEWVTLTWGTAFDNAPAVVLMPENANGASIVPYLFVQPSTTGVSIQVNVTGVPYEGLTFEFNYIVIQGK